MALQYIKENILPWMAPRKQRQSSVGEQVLKTASRQGSRQPLLPVANGTNAHHPHAGRDHEHDDIERGNQDWTPYETFPTSAADDAHSDQGSSKSSRFRVSPRIVSDAILGLSDGLTVPFAVSAGLSAFGDTKVVVLGSLAELVAGAISMGLGGYVGAKSEVESYEATKRETKDLIRTSPLETQTIVEEVFRPFNLPASPVSEMSANLHSYPERLMDFLLTFYHKQSEPDCNQAYISAVTLALGYFIGGFIPLIPYFCVRQVLTALYWSIGVMAVTLFAFGYIKTCIVRGWTGRENIAAGMKGGCQMFLVGGLAAGSAIALVRIIDHSAKT